MKLVVFGDSILKGVITIPNTATATLGELTPDFTGLSKKDLLPLMEKSKGKLNINGSGWVTSQNPEPGTPLTENTIIELYLE